MYDIDIASVNKYQRRSKIPDLKANDQQLQTGNQVYIHLTSDETECPMQSVIVEQTLSNALVWRNKNLAASKAFCIPLQHYVPP